MSKLILNYPLFDGFSVKENASVIIENGMISAVTEAQNTDSGYFLMPGLIDAHTHINTESHVKAMLENGVTTACDVAASSALVSSAKPFTVIPSAGMAMGVVFNPKGFVEKAMANGARYIKVLLFNTLSIGKTALRGIVKAAHENGLKVAAHATELATMRQAVDADVDILLHVPMKGAFPETLAKEIAEKGIVVAPTLTMMEAFSISGRGGYKPSDYQNAENAVKTLHDCKVTILAATDANDGSFAPEVAYGSSLHREMELLAKTGMTPLEVLTASTSKTAKVFNIENAGTVAEGKRATLLLIKGRPDKDIIDTGKIEQIWIDGEALL